MEEVLHALEYHAEIDRNEFQLYLSALDAAHLEYVIDQSQQVLT